MAFDAGSAQGHLILDAGQFLAEIKKSQKANNGMTASIFKANVAYDAFKKVLSTTAVTVKQSINLAKDFAEENSKFNTVFKDVGKSANDMRKSLVDSYGLSKKASTELLASTGDLLSGFGFAGKDALKLSGEVQKLAVDLASFTNYSGGAKGASEALTKALLGERESVKSLGISIMEADIQAELLAQGKENLTGLALRQAKAEITLQLALQQSKNAIGDYARTSDQLANRQRQLSSVTEDIQVLIGETFTPILNDLTGSLLNGARGFRDFLSSADGIDKISITFGILSGTIEVGKQVFKDLYDVISKSIKPVIDNIKESFSKLTEESQGNVKALTAFQAVTKLVGMGLSIIIKIVASIIQGFIDYYNILKEVGLLIKDFFAALANPTKWKQFQKQLKDSADAFKDFGKNLIENTSDVINTVKEEWTTFPEELKDPAKSYTDIFEKASEEAKKKFLKNKQEMTEGEDKLNEKIASSSKTKLQSWVENVKSANAKAAKAFEENGKEILDNVSFVAGQIADAYNSIAGVVQDYLDNEVKIIEAKGQEKLSKLESEKEERLTQNEDFFTTRQEQLLADYENSLISEEEYNEQKNLLDQQKADKETEIQAQMDSKIAKQKDENRKKENAAKKKAFEAQKANQIANIWIQYAIGLVGLWAQSIAQLGPIAGSVLAGIMTGVLTGVAIAQTAIISQQNFIPERKIGGMASGVTRVNEAGGEIITLPDGSLVIPNDISQQIANNTGGGEKNITINVNNPKLNNKMDVKTMVDQIIIEMTRRKAFG